MRILIEGPDCTGKTALSKTFTNAFNADYLHFSYEPNDEKYLASVNDTYSLLDKYGKENLSIVIDRFIFSEIVYGDVVRNSIRFDQDKSLTQVVDSFDHIIFCLPFEKTKYIDFFNKKSMERVEYINEDNVEEIYNGYQKLYIQIKNINADKVTRYDIFR